MNFINLTLGFFYFHIVYRPKIKSYMWIYVKVCEKNMQVKNLRSLLSQKTFETQMEILWFNASLVSCVPGCPSNKRLHVCIWGHQVMCYISELLLLKSPSKREEYIAYELLFPNIVWITQRFKINVLLGRVVSSWKKLKQCLSAVNNVLFLIYFV